MAERSSIFDMIGPVMIGPSSSHTAGVARIGRVARKILGETPQEVEITFYNSFARTYEGHGSDRAILAGLMGMAPDDDRLKDSPELAKKEGLNYNFKTSANASALHPNSIKIKATGVQNKTKVLGISRGGGLISIVEIDGFSCNFTSQVPTLIVTAQDQEGSIAFISNVLQYEKCNIATLTVNRKGKKDLAKLVFELDSEMRELSLTYLRSLDWIHEVQYLNPTD
ncbi:MAG: L-serine ammonia-lyase, iron-sulfur-dependent subunit beta [Bacteroidia bacterium]|nr:L-serine ammonia-lyase, iron-sulfur-dependent subunit beta [Bacteroidia bacterium]